MASGSDLEVRVTRRDGVATLTLVGPVEMGTAWLLATRGREALAGGRAHLLLVDLGGVTFLDSTGLQALEELRADVIEQLGYLVLVPGSPSVQRVLEFAGLTQRFQFLDRPARG